MTYPYRWYLASLFSGIILLFGYGYDLKPIWNELHTQKINEKTMASELTHLHALLSSNRHDRLVKQENFSNQTDHMQVIPALVAIVRLQGLHLQSIQEQAPLLHLVVRGNFNQLVAFTFMLANDAAMMIRDFELGETDDKQLQMTLTMRVENKIISFDNSFINTMHLQNPFCGMNHSTTQDLATSSNVLSSISLHQIKMVGYIHQGDRSAAMILLPNETTMSIAQGFILGAERGVVTQIQHNQINLTLSTGETTTIRMSN